MRRGAWLHREVEEDRKVGGQGNIGLLYPAGLGPYQRSVAQERIKIAYSSADASNTVWFTALDAGMYRKHGLDVELIFIQSSTMSVSTVVSGDIQIANVPEARWRALLVGGANLVMTACYINTLPYELIVQESVKSVEDLRGKSVGISRVGSSSDVAARVLIKGLGLGAGKGCADYSGGRSHGASGGVSNRKDCRIPIAAGNDSPRQGHAASDHDQHRRLSEALRFSLHLFDHDEELFGSEARHDAQVDDGLDRGDAFSQNAQRRNEKVYRQVHAPEQSAVPGGLLYRQRKAARSCSIGDAGRN